SRPTLYDRVRAADPAEIVRRGNNGFLNNVGHDTKEEAESRVHELACGTTGEGDVIGRETCQILKSERTHAKPISAERHRPIYADLRVWPWVRIDLESASAGEGNDHRK